MLLEGRKHPRVRQRFLIQISSVHAPVDELVSVENLSPCGARITTERSWELGSHVDLKSRVGERQARARIVYCQALCAKTFAVGLDFLTQTSAWEARRNPSTLKQPN